MDSENVGVGVDSTGGDGTKVDGDFVDTESEGDDRVNVLEAGADTVAGDVELALGGLADGVGQLETAARLIAAAAVDCAHLDAKVA